MRIILIFLLLANLVMVAVNIYFPSEGAGPQPPGLPNVETLRLVSGREPGSGSQAKVPASTAEASEPPAASPPPDKGGVAEGVSPMPADAPAEGQVEAASDLKRECYTLGPYRDRELADAAAARIRQEGLPASRRSSVERELRNYWVLIPPLATKQAADAIAAQLNRRGVKDFFVTQEPPNALSLGVFSQRRYADRRVREMEDLGYEVEVEPIYRDRTVYWLDYETRGGHVVPEQVWRGSVPDAAGVERLPRDCR